MKRILLITALICSTINFSEAQSQDQKDLAKVRRINGVEAYILCEPLRDYEVLVDAGTGLKAESLLTGGIVNKTISDRVEQFIRKVTKENGRVDAVIYSTGRRIVGVQFKDKATPETKGLAKVSKVNGYPVFVMNEPVLEYESLGSKSGGIKVKSIVTGGVINNSIEEDVQQMVKRAQNRAADAILFEGGREATPIQFRAKSQVLAK
ncbi:hypothetical protein [Adhaeribacter aquaticus]|uniref:hypothetical protein n=1 Tax=Adhaeribacter aquaticus TaxID=299567 RepID=UPI0004786D83|nr:hypothetical protein [Adhaeribacter aquaticus]